ncbi:hypothetical protein GOBAR_DD17270 [Gossypium barbadense]|nr:hypothetical protein GOBAR_DD17270 [Gossypium barbadense]
MKTDVASGNDIRFNALDAFFDWKHEGLPPVEVPSAAQWKFRRTSRAGLTSEDAEVRENKFLKFLSFMWNPLSWVMEAAAVMAIVLANGGGEGLDWQDFVGIICLLIINSTISFIEENNAGNAAGRHSWLVWLLKQRFLRDGQWQETDAAILGAITKRMTANEEMAGMDVLCSDKNWNSDLESSNR